MEPGEYCNHIRQFVGNQPFFHFQVRQALRQEFEDVKNIGSVLQSFKVDDSNHLQRQVYIGRDFSGPTRYEEPTRDPDVWPPPTPIEHKPSPNIRGNRPNPKRAEPNPRDRRNAPAGRAAAGANRRADYDRKVDRDGKVQGRAGPSGGRDKNKPSKVFCRL